MENKGEDLLQGQLVKSQKMCMWVRMIENNPQYTTVYISNLGSELRNLCFNLWFE